MFSNKISTAHIRNERTVDVLDRTVHESIFSSIQVGYTCVTGGLYKSSYVTKLPHVGKTLGRKPIAYAAIPPEYKDRLFFIHFPR